MGRRAVARQALPSWRLAQQTQNHNNNSVIPALDAGISLLRAHTSMHHAARLPRRNAAMTEVGSDLLVSCLQAMMPRDLKSASSPSL